MPTKHLRHICSAFPGLKSTVNSYLYFKLDNNIVNSLQNLEYELREKFPGETFSVYIRLVKLLGEKMKLRCKLRQGPLTCRLIPNSTEVMPVMKVIVYKNFKTLLYNVYLDISETNYVVMQEWQEVSHIPGSNCHSQ